MQVELEPKLQRFVDEQVRNGRFPSPEALINTAVASLHAEDALAGEISAENLAELKTAIAEGMEQADRGESAPWDPADVTAEVERRYEQEQRRGNS
jgi:Arc/MetJ-type ribon-helix-helix transcriptional regulator